MPSPRGPMAFQGSDRMRSRSAKFHRIVMAIVLALVCAGDAAAQKNGELARATALNQQGGQINSANLRPTVAPPREKRKRTRNIVQPSLVGSGSPSWTRIEPCASLRNRSSGSYSSEHETSRSPPSPIQRVRAMWRVPGRTANWCAASG
jgi:hypothetical protein